MPQTVTIDFEGIMVLSFKDDKCVVGIPPTDDLHEFVLIDNDTAKVIGKRSRLYIADADGKPISSLVNAGSIFNHLIDFKYFHGHAIDFKHDYGPRNRMEILNGTFSIESSQITRATFRRANSSTAEPEKMVAVQVRLTINFEAGYRVVFEDVTGTTTLETDHTYRINNLCYGGKSVCGEEYDFRYYYNAFNVRPENQMLIVDFERKLGSPDLPCWPGGYNGEPSQPPAE